MVFEASALLRYRLVKELWLRAGYQYYCITGLALARGNFRAGVTAASWASTARRWAWNWTG